MVEAGGSDDLLVMCSFEGSLAPGDEPGSVHQNDDTTRFVLTHRGEIGRRVGPAHGRVPVDVRMGEWSCLHSFHRGVGVRLPAASRGVSKRLHDGEAFCSFCAGVANRLGSGLMKQVNRRSDGV